MADRIRRYGPRLVLPGNGPLAPGDARLMASIERFNSFVVVNDPGECYGWTGRIDPAGYARFGDGVIFGTVYSHIIAFLVAGGEIPVGYEVDHACHSRDESCVGLGAECLHRRCTFPEHLEAITLKANRAMRRTAPPSPWCPQGHLMDETNTYINPRKGSRHCRECMRVANRVSHERYKTERNAARNRRR